jgi:hypothetical protein
MATTGTPTLPGIDVQRRTRPSRVRIVSSKVEPPLGTAT